MSLPCYPALPTMVPLRDFSGSPHFLHVLVLWCRFYFFGHGSPFRGHRSCTSLFLTTSLASHCLGLTVQMKSVLPSVNKLQVNRRDPVMLRTVSSPGGLR